MATNPETKDAAAGRLFLPAPTPATTEPEICGWCNGTGEGGGYGSRCQECHGAGMVEVEVKEWKPWPGGE